VGREVHLARRFLGALSPAAPKPDDVAWVASVLNSRELRVWDRLPRHDRRHSIAVARRVEATLADTEHAGDPRWLEAALLHDVGKLDAHLGVFGRVAATLAGAVAGHDMADAWSGKQGITRRFGLYLRHPELGATRIRLCEGSREAAVWAEAHQDPDRYDRTGIPRVVIDALVAADDD
jgi:hypothetical protein